MTLAILVLVLGPSVAVFLAACLITMTRSWQTPVQAPVRVKADGRAI